MILLKKEEELVLTREGFFTRVKKRPWHRFQNAYDKKSARLLVFHTFCHPLKNPLCEPYLKLVYEKTKDFAYRALEALETLIDLEEKKVLVAVIHNYEKITLAQLRILRLMKKAAKRKQSALVYEAKKALEQGKNPIRPSHGASGSYYMPGTNLTITGVFKPFDEEIGAPNNPRKIGLRGAIGKRAGHFQTRVGEGILREIAAYEIDKALSLSLVPYTTCVSFSHAHFFDNGEGHHLQTVKKKIGSFQEFRAGFFHIYEISQKALEGITLDQLQRVVILDILLGNQDRNASNLLTNGKELVAIDHGFSLSPALIQTALLKDFRDLPQMQLPFLPFIQAKITHLNLDKLLWKLKKRAFIDESSLERFQERLALLKAAMKEGVSVNEILRLMHPKFLVYLLGYQATLEQRASSLIRMYKSRRSHKNKVSF